jgi:heme exporter protein C
MASTPRRGHRPATVRRRDLGWLAVGLGAGGLLVALLVAPTDAVQGEAQRLMYLHVPAAWTAYLAFAAVLGASCAYLTRRDLRYDRYARVAAEIGVAATALAIAVGSVWGHAVWGVWWSWDPRLVSTALLLLGYAGYLAARRLAGDAHRDARRSAVTGIAGFALVPVVHFSVVWWRSLHQPATVLAADPTPPIDPLMAAALLLCLAAFVSAASWFYLWRLSSLERSPARDKPGTGAPTANAAPFSAADPR